MSENLECQIAFKDEYRKYCISMMPNSIETVHKKIYHVQYFQFWKVKQIYHKSYLLFYLPCIFSGSLYASFFAYGFIIIYQNMIWVVDFSGLKVYVLKGMNILKVFRMYFLREGQLILIYDDWCKYWMFFKHLANIFHICNKRCRGVFLGGHETSYIIIYSITLFFFFSLMFKAIF